MLHPVVEPRRAIVYSSLAILSTILLWRPPRNSSSQAAVIQAPSSVQYDDCARRTALASTFCQAPRTPRRDFLREARGMARRCDGADSKTRSAETWDDLAHVERRVDHSYQPEDPPVYFTGPGDADPTIHAEQEGWWGDVAGWRGSRARVHPADLDRCHEDRGATSWSVERFGPMRGHGQHDWHTWAWPRAWGLTPDDIWATGFYFALVSETGEPYGYPPLHVHHMHVTSTQSFFRYALDREVFGQPNSNGVVGTEFDVHGDRQCFANEGGVDCQSVVFPDGFGMPLSDPMQVFGQVNDERPSGKEPPLVFWVEQALRWTRVPQRAVGRLVTGITGGLLPDGRHDTTPMTFGPTTRREYLLWKTVRFPGLNLTFVDNFWHTHHAFTYDMWLVAADAGELQLLQGSDLPTVPGSHAVELVSRGTNVHTVAQSLVDRIETAQRECARNVQCTRAPRLLCTTRRDIYEVVDEYGAAYDRWRPARYCPEFSLRHDESLVMLSLHRAMGDLPRDVLHWQHAAWYSLYVQSSPEDWIPGALYGRIPSDVTYAAAR